MLKDILLDWILFSFIEAFTFSCFVVGKNSILNKKYKYFPFLIVFSLINSCVYCTLIHLPIPFLNQIYLIIALSIFIHSIFKIKWLSIIIKLLIIYGINFICDGFMYFIFIDTLNTTPNIFNVFLCLIPSKLFQVFLAWKGVGLMKASFGTVVRR